MQKTIISRFFYLSFFLVLTSFSNSATNSSGLTTAVKSAFISSASTSENSSAAFSAMLFDKMSLGEKGLSKDVLDNAINGFKKLVDDGVVENSQYLTIVDLSQSSRKKRLYLIDLDNQELAMNTFVSHGKNSGIDRAERFSNVPQSEQSSLGFYVTKNTYTGKHGLSLRLAGVEEGFNDNAESRAIVVHGAEYVNAGRVNSAYMGRSQGCPAVPQAEASKLIKKIKGGSALFIYHPTEKYLNKSELLNS